MDHVDPKRRDEVLRELEAVPPIVLPVHRTAAPVNGHVDTGRRPRGWGADDDAAEASSMRVVAELNRQGLGPSPS